MNRLPLHLIVRRVHLLLGLFLAPWVLMYSLSTLGMHHRKLFTGNERRVHPGYELISEQKYPQLLDADGDRHSAALQILRDLDMEGAYSVRGTLQEGHLTIIRDQPVRPFRVTYLGDTGTLRIERQNFGLTYFLEMLHRRRGYQQDYMGNDLWALVVDGVILTILIWAITGIWMWWSMLRTRKPGAWCLVAGVTLFLVFLLIM